jgi:hypothetical protein
VHGRTRACAYVGPVEYETIRAVKAAVRIPVMANGDIATPSRRARARAHRRRRHHDRPRRARAGRGSSARFGTISTRDFICPRRRSPRRAREILRHLDDHYAFYGEAAGVRIARKHLGWYTKDLAGGDAFRREMNRLEASEEQIAAVGRFFDTLAAMGERLDYRAPVARDRRREFEVREVATRVATGRGGPGRVRKTLRINTGNEIGKTVEKSLDEYFRKLDGEPPHGIYDMVINHVERAVIQSVMVRTGAIRPRRGHAGNEPQHAAGQAHEVRHSLTAPAPGRRARRLPWYGHVRAHCASAAVGVRQDGHRCVRARPLGARHRPALHRRYR